MTMDWIDGLSAEEMALTRALGSKVSRLRRLARPLLMTLLSLCMPASSVGAFPEVGILQFDVQHNLETSDCLGDGSCFLEFERESPAAWLSEIADHSSLAVLHWDSAIPWLVFDVDPPVGVDRVAHYDSTLDATTVAKLDAFVAHFAAMGRSYLAVSLLSGERDRLAPLHVDGDTQVSFSTSCPDFSPGSQITIDPGSGPVAFDLERSYRNFLLYLSAKLSPDYFGLMVEVNLVETMCPSRADGLYTLYRALHDAVELEIGPDVPLFATLVYPLLLEYERTGCYPTSTFTPCASPAGPPFPDAGVESCYPVNRNAIDALELGGRLDLLALSFYPDSLETSPVPGETSESRAYPLADWDAGADCQARLVRPAPVDPMAAIDRLGWTGPVGIAETSARACPSPLRIDIPGPGGASEPFVFEVSGTPASQAAWVEQTFRAAVDGDYAFYLHSFLRDYAPAGTWTVEAGVLPASIQALFNTWPCSGFQDASGQLKPGIAAIGLPEPALTSLLVAGSAWLGMLGRTRWRPNRSPNRADSFARLFVRMCER